MEKSQPYYLDVKRLNNILEKGEISLPLLSLGQSVHHAARLVNLDFGLVHGVTQSLASGRHRRAADADSFGNLVTGEALALVLGQELKHTLAPSRDFALLLAVGALALLVAGVQPSDVLGGQRVHLSGQVGVKHVLEILPGGDGVGGHGFSFLASCAYGVGRHPIYFGFFLSPLQV